MTNSTQEAAHKLTAGPCRYCANQDMGPTCHSWQLRGPDIDNEGRMPRELAELLASAPTLAEEHRLLTVALRNMIDTPPLGEPGHVDLQDAVREARAILDQIERRRDSEASRTQSETGRPS